MCSLGELRLSVQRKISEGKDHFLIVIVVAAVAVFVFRFQKQYITSIFLKDIAHHTLSFQVGESYVCSKCKSRCTCKASGTVSCQQISCVDGEECGVKEGARGCFTKQRKCSISKKGHITSYDGMSGAIASKGAFELTSLCDQTKEQWFRVVVDTRVCSKGASPTVATLYVFYKDTTVAVNSQLLTWVRRGGRV